VFRGYPERGLARREGPGQKGGSPVPGQAVHWAAGQSGPAARVAFQGRIMELTEDILRRMVCREIVGDFWPFSAGPNDLRGPIKKHQDVEGYINVVVGAICETEGMETSLAFNNLGSGFASYARVFCYRSADVLTEKRGEHCVSGLIVCLSAVAPFATVIVGEETYYRRPDLGPAGSLASLESVLSGPEAQWQDLLEKIVPIVREGGFELLWHDELAQPLGFEAKIETVLSDGPVFTVFDAMFNWMD
jgi:hypothetical protein